MKFLRLALFSMIVILALTGGAIASPLGDSYGSPLAISASDPVGEPSIVNGQVVPDEALPFYAQLAVKNETGGPPPYEHACGATLLSADWILTAGHCVWDDESYFDTTRVPGTFPTNVFRVYHPLTKTQSEVARIVLPNVIGEFWERDIALIQLKKPIPTSQFARLVSGDSPVLRTSHGVVWGKGDFSVDADASGQGDYQARRLRKAQVPINKAEFCGDQARAKDMLCAESPSENNSSPSSCIGDSGGPLTIFSDSPQNMIQVALVSHKVSTDNEASLCGAVPTWYTNLVLWSSWIKQQVPQTQFVKFSLDPKTGLPIQPKEQPAPTLGCGDSSDPGTPLPAEGAEPLVWSPMRGKDAGSAVSVGVSKIAYTHPDPNKITSVNLVGECAWADALAATALMGEGPLLMTAGNQLEADVLAEIKRLGVDEVYLVGGPKAVAPEVEQGLRAAGLKVARLFGDSRVETAAEITGFLIDTGEANKGVILARAYPAPGGSPSQAFADSLGAAYASTWLKAPILLSETSRLSKASAEIFEGWKPSHVYVMGGPAALNDKIIASIRSATKPGLPATRFDGLSRADTAKKLAEHFMGGKTLLSARGVIVIEGYADDAWKAGFTLASLTHQAQLVYALANDGTIPPESQALLKSAKAKDLPIHCVATQKTCNALSSL